MIDYGVPITNARWSTGDMPLYGQQHQVNICLVSYEPDNH